MRMGRRVFWHVVARSRLFGHITPPKPIGLISCRIDRTQRYFASAVKALTTQEQIAAAKELRVPTLVLHGTRDRVLLTRPAWNSRKPSPARNSSRSRMQATRYFHES